MTKSLYPVTQANPDLRTCRSYLLTIGLVSPDIRQAESPVAMPASKYGTA
ncbi:hypothetical protein AK34_4239 [Burkholderia dolosa AU0158]|nr:hypothetical protein AK34_4239 [Burkholderia dolosa AU0158]VWB81430.1 hypothetical protein BDO18943_03849 [Burkholderia dolosa]